MVKFSLMAPKNKDVWRRELELRMLEEVKTRPLLWDTTCQMYKRADLKPLAWEEIASIIGSPLTADMIQKRFKNIKETYTKNLNKIKASKRSGAGVDDIFKPVWYLFEFCSFLEKACAQAESSDNLQSTGTASLNESTISSSLPTYLLDKDSQRWLSVSHDDDGILQLADDSESGDLDMDDSAMGDGDEEQDSCAKVPRRPASAPVPSASTSQSGSQNNTFFNKRGTTKRSASKILEKAVNAFEKIASEPLPCLPIKDTPSDAFCHMLTYRLSEMNPEVRKKCENEILTVLLKY